MTRSRVSATMRTASVPYRMRKREILLTLMADWLKCACTSGNNSTVECNLPKVEVAGSNPVSRSKFQNNRARYSLKSRSWQWNLQNRQSGLG